MSLESVSIAFIFDAHTCVKTFPDKVMSENTESWSKPRHEREGEEILPIMVEPLSEQNISLVCLLNSAVSSPSSFVPATSLKSQMVSLSESHCNGILDPYMVLLF